ncbi:MAG: hypothetical protein Q4A72_02450 [Bacillota bacterium]|nr:hypothetical protein [Bacillota bacterium]
MLVKCETCGKFFGASSDETICSSCKEGEFTGLKHIKDPKEQRFVVARNMVYENPDISPENLVRAMRDMGIDISIKDVMSYVRQGRLTLKNAEIKNLCEDCGKKILSGRKCPTCTKKFEENLTRSREELFKQETGEESDDNKKKRKMYSQS